MMHQCFQSQFSAKTYGNVMKWLLQMRYFQFFEMSSYPKRDRAVCAPEMHSRVSPCMQLHTCTVPDSRVLYYFSPPSPQVHWEAGLLLLLEGTLGGCTWQPHSPPCWSPFWYLWTSRSLPLLWTGRSTNSRSVFHLRKWLKVHIHH